MITTIILITSRLYAPSSKYTGTNTTRFLVTLNARNGPSYFIHGVTSFPFFFKLLLYGALCVYSIERRMVRRQVKQKRLGGKRSWPNRGTIPACVRRNYRNVRETSVRKASVPANIRSEYLPNTSLARTARWWKFMLMCTSIVVQEVCQVLHCVCK
jgi:hypothetical protein